MSPPESSSATPDTKALGFGRVFTEHMVTSRWTAAGGWTSLEAEARRPLQLDPASLVLQYGQSVFDGLKAYRQPDGSVAVFRPEVNGARFQRSARRLALPELPVADFVGSLDMLIEID